MVSLSTLYNNFKKLILITYSSKQEDKTMILQAINEDNVYEDGKL